MAITRKQFEKLYSAELLPSSMANYALGDVWDWKGNIFGWRLVFLVYNMAEIFGNDELLHKLQAVQRIPANLPEIEITSDFKADTGLNIPNLSLDIKNTIKTESVKKFSFLNVEGKNTLGFKNLVDTELEKLKMNNFEKYKEDIRDCEVVVQLFYAGSVLLEVDRNISDTVDLKLKLEGANVEFHSTVEANNVERFKINSSACPFAAQFIKGRDLK